MPCGNRNEAAQTGSKWPQDPSRSQCTAYDVTSASNASTSFKTHNNPIPWGLFTHEDTEPEGELSSSSAAGRRSSRVKFGFLQPQNLNPAVGRDRAEGKPGGWPTG